MNLEINVTTEIKYAGGKSYNVKISDQDSTKGLLISPSKLLVDNYVFDFDNKVGTPKMFLLSADRIERVKFIRVD